jgi:hypothetical protein
MSSTFRWCRSVVQARTICQLALLAEAHEEQASDAERRGDVEQAMGWFADAMRLRDSINVAWCPRSRSPFLPRQSPVTGTILSMTPNTKAARWRPEAPWNGGTSPSGSVP